MLRILKTFNDSRNNPSFSIKIQQFDDEKREWCEIPEVWASEKDKKKYENAMMVEYARFFR